MKVYLASDHAGFELKEKIKTFLSQRGYETEDLGAYAFDKDDDYPDFIQKAALSVSNDPSSKGVVIGKSGTGEAIVADKFKNVRSVLGFSRENVKLSRQHNDANVLSIGSYFVYEELAKELVRVFLETPFSNEERHVRRLNKIKEIEEKCMK